MLIIKIVTIKKTLLSKLFLLIGIISFSQTTQTIRGKVVDKESRYPLIGVNVIVISDTTKLLGGATDLDGNYRIEGVKLGRQTIKVTYLGYYDKIIPVVVNSGKELILNVDIEESALEMKAIEITADENG